MASLSPGAHALLASQHGIIGSKQLVNEGHTPGQIRSLQRQGSLIHVVRGAYRSPSVPFTEVSRCAAVSIARPHTAIAGPTAGRLWGFRLMPRSLQVSVIAPPASNPAIAPWVDVYRTAAIHPQDVIQWPDGIHITSRARTAFDLARWLPPATLLSVIEQAAHDGGLNDRDLHAVAADWVSRQRPWATTYLDTLGRRLPGGSAESHPEVRVANTLRGLGVGGLVRQHRFRLRSGRWARFDLAIPSRRIAIEVDVHPRHDETAGRLADGSRDDAASEIGWTTIRISRADYHDRFTERLAEVAEQVRTNRAMSEPAG